MWSRTWHWGGGVRSVGQKKNLDPQFFWPFSTTDTMVSWNNNWKPKKNAEVQVLCYFSPNLATQSKPVKSWTFLGEIVVSLIPLNPFHSESRLHIGAPKTWKSQRHCALGCVMSQKEKSTCNITIYGRRWGWGVKLRGQKKLPTPGSKFFPGTPLKIRQGEIS
jgi:hypothetical protein